MTFKLEEVNPEADFAELMICLWESYEEPYQSLFRLFCPIPEGKTREVAIKESTVRQLDWFHADPTSYWQKITDSETGKIVAGALWKICKSNPFEPEESHEAFWFPEGGQRNFVTQALKLFEAPRARMAPKPQLCRS